YRVVCPSPPVTLGKFSPEQSGALGTVLPPSGTHRSQVASQYSENQGSSQALASKRQLSQVAPGHSGSGGGALSSQTSGGAPPLPLGPVLGTQRPQVASQYSANQGSSHALASVFHFSHVASGQVIS